MFEKSSKLKKKFIQKSRSQDNNLKEKHYYMKWSGDHRSILDVSQSKFQSAPP